MNHNLYKDRYAELNPSEISPVLQKSLYLILSRDIHITGIDSAVLITKRHFVTGFRAAESQKR